MLKTAPWSASDHLDSSEAIVAYLEAALEDGDRTLLRAAIDDVCRACGTTEVSLVANADVANVIRRIRSFLRD